jgi:hypothetical protein
LPSRVSGSRSKRSTFSHQKPLQELMPGLEVGLSVAQELLWASRLSERENLSRRELQKTWLRFQMYAVSARGGLRLRAACLPFQANYPRRQIRLLLSWHFIIRDVGMAARIVRDFVRSDLQVVRCRRWGARDKWEFLAQKKSRRSTASDS